MRRPALIFLIFCFLISPFSAFAEETSPTPPAGVPIYLVIDQNNGILGIVPITKDFFLWAYVNTATTTYPSLYFNTDLTTQREHIFANGIPVATVEASSTIKVFWNSQDQLQSTSVVTDSSAAIKEQTEFYAFGEMRTDSGSHKEQRKYTGHEFDAQPDYTYAGARYLNTKMGRFLSEDQAFLEVDY